LKQVKTGEEWSLSLRDRTLISPYLDQKLRLTSREKTLLVALAQAKENTLESTALCDLFGDDDDEAAGMSKHALEELVARLRKKLKSVQPEDAEAAVKSVWSVGYQLCIQIKFVF
jgi:DNA-binding response OmpR family regulator